MLRASRCNGLREINRIGWALLQARASESFRRTDTRKAGLSDHVTSWRRECALRAGVRCHEDVGVKALIGFMPVFVAIGGPA